MRYFLSIFAAFVSFSFNLSAQDQCQQACSEEELCRGVFYINDKAINYFSNYPLNQPNDCVKQVIFAIHGTERNSWSRYEAVIDGAKAEKKESQVLVISPFFKTEEDEPKNGEAFWSNHGWKQGNTSNNDRKNISSFAVIDAMIDNVVGQNNFLELKKISVTGHSAGGQFTQLYALTSQSPQTYSQLEFSFLVLNPSNYSYLNQFRPHPWVDNKFEVPVYMKRGQLRMVKKYEDFFGDCASSFNNYKYGLEDRNSYSKNFYDQQLKEQFISRNVFYFLGSKDNLEDEYLNDSCGAKIQGKNRLDRGIKFFNYLNSFYPEHHHAQGIVEDVGHDARQMYLAKVVRDALFN